MDGRNDGWTDELTGGSRRGLLKSRFAYRRRDSTAHAEADLHLDRGGRLNEIVEEKRRKERRKKISDVHNPLAAMTGAGDERRQIAIYD